MGLLNRIAQEQERRFRATVTAPNGQAEPVLVRLHREGAPLGQPIAVAKGFPAKVVGGIAR